MIAFKRLYSTLIFYSLNRQSSSSDKQEELQQKTRKNFILDAMCQAGTNPAITAVMKLIKQQKVTGEKAAQLISTFALYIRHPTPELLKEIFVSTSIIVNLTRILEKIFDNDFIYRSSSSLLLSNKTSK